MVNSSKPNQVNTINTSIKKLTLSQLFTLKSSQWLFAWALGLITLFATIGLLSISGWFISAAAMAGIMASIATGMSAISFDFFRPAAVIRTFAITRTAGRYGERLASHHAVLGLLTDLRCFFFDAIGNQSLKNQRKQGVNQLIQSADAMQRLTHDIDQLDELPLRFWAPWFWALTLQLLLLGFIALFSPALVLIVAVPLCIAGVVIPAVGILLGKGIALEYTQLAESRRRALLNPLTASTSLILWNKWQDFQHQFHQHDKSYNQLHLRQRRVGILLNALQQILLAIVIALLIWQSYPLIVNNTLSVPMLLAYVLALLGMYEVVLPLASNYTAYGFAVSSKDRLNALLNTDSEQESSEQESSEQESSEQENVATTSLTQILSNSADKQLTLTAKNIAAKFPDALIGLANTSFMVKDGDVLFIKGRSGAGKSTLLHTLAGELPLTSGSLTLNNVPLSQINMTDDMGYLAQQLDIFDLTLAENLRVGKTNATDEELWHVLEKVKLANWARQQPTQLNTPLGEYGSAVSGGQARRIALARLLLKPRKLLLLDEPFAGLDHDTSAHVYTALKQQQHDGMLIIVSHHFIADDAKQLTI